MTFESLLLDKVDIYSRTATVNDLGEKTYSWSKLYSNVKTRLSPLSGEEISMYPGEWKNLKYKAFFEYDTDLNLNYRIYKNSSVYQIREIIVDTESNHKKAILSLL